jgi:hypothetical protein
MSDIAYKIEKIGKADIEFRYYIKQFKAARKHHRRVARAIKRGAKQRMARDIQAAWG